MLFAFSVLSAGAAATSATAATAWVTARGLCDYGCETVGLGVGDGGYLSLLLDMSDLEPGAAFDAKNVVDFEVSAGSFYYRMRDSKALHIGTAPLESFWRERGELPSGIGITATTEIGVPSKSVNIATGSNYLYFRAGTATCYTADCQIVEGGPGAAFRIEPVPIPAALGLMAAIPVAFAAIRRRKRAQTGA